MLNVKSGKKLSFIGQMPIEFFCNDELPKTKPPHKEAASELADFILAEDSFCRALSASVVGGTGIEPVATAV